MKLSSSFWKAALQPRDVALARARLFQAVGEDGGPGMHRRIHVAEVPFVGGNLAVRVQVVLAQHQIELLLAEIHVHQRERQDMEGEIPRGVPGILPFVRHGDDVGVVHVVPLRIARRLLGRRQVGIAAPLFEPAVHVVIEELLGPQHPGQGLAHDVGRVGIQRARDDAGVEFIRLLPARLHHFVKMLAERAAAFPVGLVQGARRHGGQSQPNDLALSGRDGQAIVRRGLRPGLLRIHGVGLSVDDEVVDAVLDERRPVLAAEQPLRVGFVFREQQ